MEKPTNIEKIQKAKKDGTWPTNSIVLEISSNRWLLAGPTGNTWGLWLFEPSGYWNYQIAKNISKEVTLKMLMKILKEVNV